jgi:hypothetical protein
MINEYQTKSQLNPTLWSGDRLRPKLRVAFLKIANAFYKFLEIPPEAEIMDIVLIGSNANYNWNEHSDIDLHVLINYLQIDPNYHMANKYLHAKKSVWNANYPLEYKGMRIELYAQDSAQELHASVGIYSVLHGKWIRKPDPDVVSIDDSIIELKAEPYQYEIDSLELDDPHLEQKIATLKKRLRDLRQSGLDAAGEYSVENLAYKHLRNKGYLDKLKELEHRYTMADLQIESVTNTPDVTESLIQHVTGTAKLTAPDWKRVMQQTDAVMDPMGQWRYPGRCTMIPTANGQITMQNVPHEVLGIDTTGHSIMMSPGQQYKFPGRLVFEIPNTAQWQTMIMQLQNALKNGTRYAK